MIRKVIIIIVCLLFMTGVGLLVYPYVSQWMYDQNAAKIMGDFDRQMEQRKEKEESTAQKDTISYLQELYSQMQAYNKDLFENGQDGFKDAWSYQPASFDLTKWGFADNMVGYIDIPRMYVKLPLYLGASEENMKKGAVHLTETSLPIGGENTNCVIAAHRGYARAAMFRDIEAMQVGDEIYVTNFWETLTYKVVQTKVISPNDVKEVMIQPGRDMVTLITCHPFGHNDQRYVVYCERVT